MSLDLVFWKGADDRDPGPVYRDLMAEIAVDGVTPVDPDAVVEACRRHLVGRRQDANIWSHQPDADGTEFRRGPSARPRAAHPRCRA